MNEWQREVLRLQLDSGILPRSLVSWIIDAALARSLAYSSSPCTARRVEILALVSRLCISRSTIRSSCPTSSTGTRRGGYRVHTPAVTYPRCPRVRVRPGSSTVTYTAAYPPAGGAVLRGVEPRRCCQKRQPRERRNAALARLPHLLPASSLNLSYDEARIRALASTTTSVTRANAPDGWTAGTRAVDRRGEHPKARTRPDDLALTSPLTMRERVGHRDGEHA